MARKNATSDPAPESGLELKRGALGAVVDFELIFEKGMTALKIRNTHLKKNGTDDPYTRELLEEAEKFKEMYLLKPVKNILEEHPAYSWFSRIKGIGNENIAKVVTFIDIKRAESISALWKYAGYAVVNGVAERPKKGEKLAFNMELKTMCYRVGAALLKAHALASASKAKVGTKFGYFYEKCLEQEKRKFEAQGKTVLPTEEWVKTSKKAEHPENLVSEYYVHNRAVRRMIKLFLACLWMYWREAEGLPLRDPYALDKMDHTTLITPEEMVDREVKKVRNKKKAA